MLLVSKCVRTPSPRCPYAFKPQTRLLTRSRSPPSSTHAPAPNPGSPLQVIGTLKALFRGLKRSLGLHLAAPDILSTHDDEARDVNLNLPGGTNNSSSATRRGGRSLAAPLVSELSGPMHMRYVEEYL